MKIPPFLLLGLMAFGYGIGTRLEGQTVGTPEFDPLGEYAEADLPKQVRVMVEFIEMPQETLTELLAEPRAGANDTELRAKVAALMKENKATIVDTSVVTTRSGQRAKVESIAEQIYPTEYDPPGPFPAGGGGNPATGGRAAGDAVSRFPVTPPNPTAFEMRPVGTTLEVDPVIGADGTLIELNIAPEIVYYCGDYRYGKWKTGEAETEVTQPHFYSVKMQTAITLIDGQPHLAGVLTPKDEMGNSDRSKKILLFVRADILLVGR